MAGGSDPLVEVMDAGTDGIVLDVDVDEIVLSVEVVFSFPTRRID
jgi:hypothetical protein